MGPVGIALMAVSTAVQMSNARKRAKEQKEANAVATAGGLIKDNATRRRLAREERVRRARLLATSRASGGTGSSGEGGALAALSANFGGASAELSSDGLTAQGISAANQRAADYASKADAADAWGSLIAGGMELYDKWKTT